MSETPAAAPTPATTNPLITFDDFAKIDLRVARVLECVPHPNADKLLVLKVEHGGQTRQIVAGIRAYYQPEQLIGKSIVIVANLAPRTMRGQESQGMLLAASNEDRSKVVVVSPIEEIASGAKVA